MANCKHCGQPSPLVDFLGGHCHACSDGATRDRRPCADPAPGASEVMAESIPGEPPRCALCRGLLWNAANGANDAWFCTSVVCEGYRKPAVLPGLSRVTAATLDAADKAAAHAVLGSTLSDAAGADEEAAPEPARCTRAVCPWHPRDWPMCPLPEEHSGPCNPGPGPHAWVPVAEVEAAREQATNMLRALCYEAGGITLRDTALDMDAAACEAHLRAVLTRQTEAVEAARAESYQAGREFERTTLTTLLRKVIDMEEDERVHYEREVAELERRAKANRECAEASRARAAGLRALLARVEALS